MNKQIMTHTFCGFLCIAGCGFFYMMGGGTSEALAVEQSVDINVIPDPIVSESNTAKKSKMELFEEYTSQQQRREAEMKAEREFNSLSFFTGTTSDYEEPEQIAETKSEVMTQEEQTASLNNIGTHQEAKQPQHKATTANVSASNSSFEKTKEEKKESVDEQIARKKKEAMREKKKRISAQTGIDITDQEQEQKKEEPVSVVAEQPKTPKSKKGFQTMGGKQTESKSTLRAVVNGEQKNITTASQVKIRLLDNVNISGTTIPKGTIVYAKASFSANRMHLKTENIIYNGNIFPFDAQIYDNDGFEGLYVADNAVNDAAKETSSNTISGTSIGVTPAQRTLSNVITSTTSAIKNATSNKIRETKVTLPANYEVFIKQKK